jgi:repressor LexA
MAELTPRQSEILSFIQEFIDEHGMPPTRAEIARSLGFRSANAAEEHLRALRRKGVIELIPGASRGIQVAKHMAGHLTGHIPVTDQVRHLEEVPLVGRVAAGQPILATEHIEASYRLDPGLFRRKPHYLLRVHGMSMRDAGILDGDLVAVHRTPDVRNGQIIVARLEEEVTVKRYRQAGPVVWLLPENPDFEPIRVELGSQHLVIEGVVVGVIRDEMLPG